MEKGIFEETDISIEEDCLISDKLERSILYGERNNDMIVTLIVQYRFYGKNFITNVSY